MSSETITLVLFLLALIACIVTGKQILYALLFGVVCFSIYGFYKGYSLKNIGEMLWNGMRKVKIIILVFLLIGCLTASWRICGTIPYILYYSVRLINPRYLVLCTFILCSLMSVLTGTSFGTAGTMGVICMLVSNASGLNPYLTGGAILSGVFVGDRCSPMSSSALLVCSLTETDIYRNIKNMVRTGFVPFAACLVLYTVLPLEESSSGDALSFVSVFADAFSLHWVTVLPAVCIVVLACLRVDVKKAMGASIGIAVLIAFLVQHVSASEIVKTIWSGYNAEQGGQLAILLNGGGIVSMFRVGCIVLLSSSFSGFFSETEILGGVRAVIHRVERILKPFGTALLSAVFASAISCNQSLGTILTCQMCSDFYKDKEELALVLENSVILLAALIPWGIAGSVPAATVGAPVGCMLFAFYLYLVPGWNLLVSCLKVRNTVSQLPGLR